MYSVGRGLWYWEPRVGEAFHRAVEKSVTVPELAKAIVELFTRLWSTGAKASRASLALRVYPDLANEELEEITVVDALVNLLDGLLNLEDVTSTRGKEAKAIYIRTAIAAFGILKSREAYTYMAEHIGRRVFDSEYQIKLMLSKSSLPHTHKSFWSGSKSCTLTTRMTPGTSSPIPPTVGSHKERPDNS
ncbi:hypothetical protein Pdsh_08610 [Pyrodictium delaneyi]|uniref:Uncharacterized protein n=1 Tax=Pyrodictium delaneyi TaxID=1273541 RepID=A0A211YLL2_9CREN|nr:hypothetical protein Pdsh_08610 [Pyrodictium delaneyi]